MAVDWIVPRVTKLNNVDMFTTYKLKLVSYTGENDIPARKKITEYWYQATNDIHFEDKEIEFHFIGRYTSPIDLGTCIGAFQTNLLSMVEGSLETTHPDHDITRPTELYVGRFVNGATVEILYGNVVKVKLVMTWQGKLTK